MARKLFLVIAAVLSGSVFVYGTVICSFLATHL